MISYPENVHGSSLEKPDITYPCTWPYRVIGEDAGHLSREIDKQLKTAYSFTLRHGNTSRRGNYISLHVEVNVCDEAERNAVFVLLRNITGVKMVF